MRFAPLILRAGEKASWFAMPYVIERVKAFTAEHNIFPTNPLPEIIVSKFGLGDPSCICIAILDSEEQKVVGHMVATIEVYLGEATAFIHQWQMDKETAPFAEELHSTMEAMIDSWATTCRVKSITALAESDSRVKAFAKHGYAKMATLVRRRLADG